MNQIPFLVILFTFFKHGIFQSQNTSDCGVTVSCNNFPVGCQDANCIVIIKWSTQGDGYTTFDLFGNIGPFNGNNKYLAVGFTNNTGKMAFSNVVACKTTGFVHHMQNPGGYAAPKFLVDSDRAVGLSQMNVSMADNWMRCQFKLLISNSTIENYFDLNQRFGLITAFGQFTPSTDLLLYHTRKGRYASVEQIDFTKSNFTAQMTSTTVKATSTTAITTSTTQPSTNTSIFTLSTTMVTVKSGDPIVNLASGCDTLYSCFKDPVDCTDSNCKLIYTFKENGLYTDFKIAGDIGSLVDEYLAIGFSTNDLMGDDGVVACKTSGVAHHYYNPSGHSPSAFVNSTDQSVGLTQVNIIQYNTWLICEFKRLKQNTAIVNYVDLNMRYFILGAYGPYNTQTGLLKLHDYSVSSSGDFSFNEILTATSVQTTVAATATTATPDSSSGIENYVSECGRTYGCFLSPSNCNGADCTFIFQWSDNADSTDFRILGKINSFTNRYLAIGFSNDDKMGDDSCVVCKPSTNEIQSYYNPGSQYDPSILIDPTRPSLGLTKQTVTQNGAFLICEFNRLKQYPSQQQRKRRDAASSAYFNLNNPFYILAAFGTCNPATGGNLNKHNNRIASSKAANFLTLEVIGGTADYTKYRAHGCLMVITWVLMASVGIMLARYFKFLFPDRTFFPGGVQFWFAIHRPVMASVPIVSLIALLVILSACDWNWIRQVKTSSYVHSIFGIVSIGLAFIQPFMALLRPDKDHPKRWIFNWSHRSVGLSAYVFALVALFLGSTLTVGNFTLFSTGWAILLAWAIFTAICVALLEIASFRDTTAPAPAPPTTPFLNPYAGVNLPYYWLQHLKQTMPQPQPQQQQPFGHLLKQIVLVAYVIVTIGITIALLVVIGAGGSNYDV